MQIRSILAAASLLILAASFASATPGTVTGRYFVGFHEAPAAMAFDPASNLGVSRAESGRPRLDPRSAEVQRYVDSLQSDQDRFMVAIQEALGRDVRVEDRLKYALNAVVLELSFEEALKLIELDFVAYVEVEEVMELQTDAGPSFIGAPQIWSGDSVPSGIGNRGEGRVIGIIDSGINYEHPSYAEVAEDGYQHINPLGEDVFLGFCTTPSTAYTCNNKLIGAYTFVGGDPNDTQASVGHGSHTSSTAGGNRVSGPFVLNTGQVFAAESISGVAPRANLINYRNCAGGCGSLPQAFEQAILDGVVDAINFSIGPNAGGTTQDPWVQYQTSMLSAVNAGIFVAASAGNTRDTMPSPTGNVANKAPWIMTVANSSHNRAFGHRVSVTGPGTPPDELVGQFGNPGSSTAPTVDIEAQYVYSGAVDPANWLGCSPWPANTFDNRIVLIVRGECAFADKINNAAAAGAEAVIIVNNAGNAAPGMSTVGATLPAVSVGNSVGVQIIGYGDTNPGATLRIAGNAAPIIASNIGNALSSGSLTGPNQQFDVTSPDVTAPGSNVLAATASGAAGDYRLLSGTSMSGPHVAGSGALMMNAHPDWTIQEIKSAITSTANPVTLEATATVIATPDEVGAGMTSLGDAVRASLVLHETVARFSAANPSTGGDPATLNIASMRRNACGDSCSWTRRVRNSLDGVGSWTASTELHPEQLTSGLVLSVEPQNFELLPGDVFFKHSFEADQAPNSSFQTLEVTASGATAGSFRSGYVVLEEASETTPTQRLNVTVRR